MIEQRTESLGVHGGYITTIEPVESGRVPIAGGAVKRSGDNRPTQAKPSRSGPKGKRISGIFGRKSIPAGQGKKEKRRHQTPGQEMETGVKQKQGRQ